MSLRQLDTLDQRLIQLYADQKTNNDDYTSKIDPEDVWANMKIVALNNQVMMNINRAKL